MFDEENANVDNLGPNISMHDVVQMRDINSSVFRKCRPNLQYQRIDNDRNI